MLSKAKIKYIQSLSIKKFREKHCHFIIEGEKIIYETISNNSDFQVTTLIGTEYYFNSINLKKDIHIDEIIKVEPSELKKISSLKTAANALAIVNYPDYEINKKEIHSNLSLLLDNIQDPGNLGTIIRTADWFGIKNIFCSTDCVDVFNPKVIQSTMGSFLRVKVFYVDLNKLIKEFISPKFHIYGAFLNGNSIYKENLSNTGFIVLGNESKGISQQLEKIISHKIFIPPFPNKNNTAESLNVGTAAAIICGEFRKS